MTAAPASPDCAAELLLSGITAQRATDGILEWKLAGLPMETAAS
jgi:rhodanese-related sulfurtransferase